MMASSAIDKMFEIYTFYENRTEIYIFFENRTEIRTFFENRIEICILFENRIELIVTFCSKIGPKILSMADEVTIRTNLQSILNDKLTQKSYCPRNEMSSLSPF